MRFVHQPPFTKKAALNHPKKPKVSARQAFEQAWKSYGERIARILFAGYDAGQREMTITATAKLVRLRRNQASGKDDVVELSFSLRVPKMRHEDILLKHYEELAQAGLLNLAARIAKPAAKPGLQATKEDPNS